MTTTVVESAPVTVDALLAAPPLVSLLGACQSLGLLTEGDEAHWGLGVRWLPENTTPPVEQTWWTCYEDGGSAPTPPKARENEHPDIVRARPFDIYRTLGVTGAQFAAEDWRARARRRLVASQSHLVEYEVWTGDTATAAGFPNQFLNDANATALNSGTALGYVQALAELEQAVADHGGLAAMIHAQWRLVSIWSKNGLITPAPSGKYLRTALGTVVVAGSGYPGSSDEGTPDAATADESTAWVTPLVRVWLGPIREHALEGLGTTADFDVDPDINDVTVRVERTVVYGWDSDSVQHSVRVDLTTEHVTP